jgi:hypothetical protein
MDGSLLYQRTFLDSESHKLIDYFHFYFAVFGGWFIGYFAIRKLVDKYNTKYIFRVSLLISAISIYIQYKTNHHQMERLFSQLIIDNVFCSILLGLLSHSIVKIINEKNELYYIKKQKHYSIIVLLVGYLYSYVLTDDKLDEGFLLSTLVYFCAYIYFLKNGIDKLDYEVSLRPTTPVLLTCLIAVAGIAAIYYKVLENFKFYSEEPYPIFVFILFLLFEATQHEKNLIENLKNQDKVNLEKTEDREETLVEQEKAKVEETKKNHIGVQNKKA